MSKAYLLYDNNGESYEDYSEWVKTVLLVPDTFNPDEDLLDYYHRLKTAHPEWFRKDGKISGKHSTQAEVAYEADLRARFESIPFLPVPWPLQ